VHCYKDIIFEKPCTYIKNAVVRDGKTFIRETQKLGTVKINLIYVKDGNKLYLVNYLLTHERVKDEFLNNYTREFIRTMEVFKPEDVAKDIYNTINVLISESKYFAKLLKI